MIRFRDFVFLPRLVLLAAFCTLLPAARAWSPPAVDDGSDTCLACHGDKTMTTKHGKQTVSIYVDGKRFAASVHAALSCTGCHSDLEGKDIPHPAPAKVDCGNCHGDEQKPSMRARCMARRWPAAIRSRHAA